MDGREIAGVQEIERSRNIVADALATRSANMAMDLHDARTQIADLTQKLAASEDSVTRLQARIAELEAVAIAAEPDTPSL